MQRRRRAWHARLLVPLTRAHGAPALQFEVELNNLDQLDQFRNRGVGESDEATANLMHAFSEILRAPPTVEVLRIEKSPRDHQA
jgi:hypothetical protein